MVECIRTVHLHSAAVLPKEVLWSTCGQMHPQSSSAPCSLSARVRTRHKLAGTGFSCTLQPFSPRGYGRARGMISYAPCTSLARVTADEGGGENFSNASSHATKGVNVQFFTFICNNADDITRRQA